MRIQGGIAKAIGFCVVLLGLTQVASAGNSFEAVPGEYVVKLKSEPAKLSIQSISQELGAEVIEKISKQSGAVLIRKSRLERQDFVLSALSKNPSVEYIEPNYIYRVIGNVESLPNDPELGRLWGLVNTGQAVEGQAGIAGIDVDARRAWEIETGNRDTIIAVIDTGIGYNIPDLAPNVWTNEAEKNGRQGVDDDQNGFVDDIHGYDFVNNDGDPMDDHGHGSHCSGTIGANGNDGVGVVGVNWKAKIMGVKFLSGSGSGTLAGAVKAIDYATQMGAKIQSNSWGGGGFTQALYDAIERANAAGSLFVAAAGNSSADNDTNPGYPASYENANIISVAAIDNTGQLASFSSYGRNSVDVAAPGVNVLSTTPDGYQSWSGTSMATPHVSGVAALVWANQPNLTMAELRTRIISTARVLGSLRNKMASSGLVNAYHALTNTLPPADPNDPFNWDKKAHQVSTDHPYVDKFKQSWTIDVPGARRIAVYFNRFETEAGYDKVTFTDKNGQQIGVWSGTRNESFSPVIEGDRVVITFETDDSVQGYGFDVEAVAYQ